MKHLLYIFVLASLISTGCTADKSLEVTYPEGGENWIVGTTQKIQWNACKVNQVDIYYLMETLSPIKIDWHSLAVLWEVPNIPGECRIVISEYGNPLITDTSEYFTILKALIYIDYPGEGALFRTDSTYKLEWSKNGIDKINLFYSTTPDEWIVIDSLDAHTYYNWKVPAGIASETCRIRIESANNSEIFNESELFIIWP